LHYFFSSNVATDVASEDELRRISNGNRDNFLFRLNFSVVGKNLRNVINLPKEKLTHA